MKKLIAIFAVLLFAVPALAVDWTFGGSQRMATFYNYRDFGNLPPNAGVNGAGLYGDQQGTVPGDQKNDAGTVWDFASNSRLKAAAKADKVAGYLELSLSSTDTHDGAVGTRRAYGTWKFAENASLKVGKDYTPVSQLLSGQQFYEDIGMLGLGTNYGRRPGQLALQVGGFELALIQPNGTVRNTYGGDTDEYLPKMEASYSMKLDKVNFKAFGGLMYFNVEPNGGTVQDDLDITAYIIGGDATVNVGAFKFTVLGGYGQNWSNGRWNDVGFTNNANAGATQNASGRNVDDCESFLLGGVVGLKFTDTVAFEVGGGYRSDDKEKTASKDEAWQAYANVAITLAPGVFLIPEVGYYDWMNNSADVREGYQWYAGAKWQIDF